MLLLQLHNLIKKEKKHLLIRLPKLHSRNLLNNKLKNSNKRKEKQKYCVKKRKKKDCWKKQQEKNRRKKIGLRLKRNF